LIDHPHAVVYNVGQSFPFISEVAKQGGRFTMTKYQHFNVEQDKGVTVATLTDPELLDRLLTNELQDELIKFVEAEKPSQLIISFQEVRRCSTEIINALLRSRKRMSAHDGKLQLCQMRDEIREVFRLLNLEGTVFNIYKTVSDASKDG
jgi:anti-anti-sigma regulatory factor